MRAIIRAFLAIFIAASLAIFGPLPAAAQPSGPVPKDIGFDQRLGERVPLDIELYDETGSRARLGDYFNHQKPVILALAYYECPMLCTLVLNGLIGSLKGMSLTAGSDYEVVVVSFDPRDTPERARVKKASYMAHLGRPGAEGAFHFLTGSEASIRALTQAAGFRYAYDEIGKQYAHPTGIVVLTPDGQLARYLFGVEYAPRDLRLALVEAGRGAIGGITDKLLLLCFHYDPVQGKYGALVMRMVRAGGALTLLALGASILVMSRRKRGAPRGPRGEASP